MELTILGGGQEVGRSTALLRIGGRDILIDAGAHPRDRSWENRHVKILEQTGKPLDAILITHGHLDHFGALVDVARAQKRIWGRVPPVYMHRTTAALLGHFMPENASLMARLARNKVEAARADEFRTDYGLALDAIRTFEYEELTHPFEDELAVRCLNAGHIAGACMFEICAEGKKFLATGDFCLQDQATKPGADPLVLQPDVLFMEGTYATEEIGSRKLEVGNLIQTVRRVIGRGGRVLLPAFGLGRGQELVIHLLQAIEGGTLPRVPVYADGLVRHVLGIYEDEGCLVAYDRMLNQVELVRDGEHRARVIRSSRPCVVVASSGMLFGGASVAYAEAWAGDPLSGIFFAGFQDPESPGNELLTHGRLRVGDQMLPVQAEIGRAQLTAHAPNSQLVEIMDGLDAGVVVLNHGEQRRLLQFARCNRDSRPIYVPRNGTRFDPLDPHTILREIKGGGAFASQSAIAYSLGVR